METERQLQSKPSAFTLCSLCKAINLPIQFVYSHAPSIAALKQSADDGCHLCAILWCAISREVEKPYFRRDWLSSKTSPWRLRPIQLRSDGCSGRIGIELVNPLGPLPTPLGYVVCYSKSESVRRRHNVGQGILPVADSEEAFSLARTWMDTCVKNHDCRCTTKKSFIHRFINERLGPLRLIDVGQDYLSRKTHQIKLVRFPDIGSCYFVALSYYRENSKPLTFIKGTKHLAISTLPKAFQDAVRITRALGIRYLWIDRLCVVDSLAEKFYKNSSKMSQIYAQSAVTICAASSQQDTEGCFVKRAQPSIPPCKIDADFYIAERIEPIPLWAPEAIDTQAWCFQEVAFAPRVLIYGSTMMAWLCNERIANEQWEMPCLTAPCGPMIAPFGPRVNQRQWNWGAIVSAYSRRELLEERDKLPAISAFARHFEPTFGRRYLAGLWERNIITDLLWKVDIRDKSDLSFVRRPKHYRAPTWSWASLDCPIAFPDEDIQNSPHWTEFLDARIEPTKDPFGEIKNASLRLAGPCAEVVCRNTNSSVFPACFPLVDHDSPKSKCEGIGCSGCWYTRCASCWFDVRDEEDYSAKPLLCLRMTQGYGLLLLPAEVEKGYHRRVGIATWVGKGGSNWCLDSSWREILIV